jgi:putative ABC transport system permease protein
VNIRREEIGLRMALGSSRKGIKGLLIVEGLLLLTLITLPALLIEWQFVHAGLIETYGKGYSQVTYLPDRIFLRFLITNGLTWLLMAIVIVISIWLPARRASLLAPADALHYE